MVPTKSLAAAVAVWLLGALVIALPSRADQGAATDMSSFGPPAAPTAAKARVARHGFEVTWTSESTSTPPPTHAIVDAGPGSCPVTVPATRRSAFLPMLERQSRAVIRVRLVNALGISPSTATSRSMPNRFTASSRYRALQILSITDFHGALESQGRSMGAARLAAALQRDRSMGPPSVTVSVGDNIGKSPLISDLFDERPTIEALALMRLDASTFGNHEHDRPLSHVQSMVEASPFTWTVANYSDLAAVSGPTRSVQPHVLVERGGVTVGIVGMNMARTADSVPAGNLAYGWGQKLMISRSADSVVAEARRARAAGADVVILLAHEGWSKNVDDRPVGPLIRLAEEVAGEFDVIFGGHTHEKFSSIVAGTLVVQTKALGQMYGRSRLCIDTRTGSVLGAAPSNVTAPDTTGIAEDETVASLVSQYAARRDSELSRVIGSVESPQSHGGDPALERSGDFAIGNYVADVLRREYGTDLALFNAGTFRDGLPASSFQPDDPLIQRPTEGATGPFDITLGDLTTALSPNKVVVTTAITAANLRALVERGLTDYPGNPDFLQVSGLRIEFDPSRPEGSRIVRMWDQYGWPVTDSARTYTVATLGYLATGKGRDARLFERTRTVFQRPYLTSVLEALTRDRSLGRATAIPPADGRIQRVGD